MEAMAIISFIFALAALAYGNKSKADIARLEDDLAELRQALEQLKKASQTNQS